MLQIVKIPAQRGDGISSGVPFLMIGLHFKGISSFFDDFTAFELVQGPPVFVAKMTVHSIKLGKSSPNLVGEECAHLDVQVTFRTRCSIIREYLSATCMHPSQRSEERRVGKE